jgi:cytochrome b
MMAEKRLVWDLPLRLFHWLLVVSIACSWYTAEWSEEYLQLGSRIISYTQIHFYLGYWTLGLVSFRIIWGFVGPRYARFTSFVAGPSRLMKYARTLWHRDSPPATGHNPLGGLGVMLMLLMLLAQATAGLFLIDNTEIWTAPYHSSVSAETANKLGKFHHINFNVLLWVIGLHVVAILFYRVYKGQNLVSAMITGRKHSLLVKQEDAIAGSQLWTALIVAALCAAGVWFLLHQAPPPVIADYN